MDLFVNPSGELSLYRQIMRQITDAIVGGRLKPGDKLTSHFDIYNPYAVGCDHSRRFLEWQFSRATVAVYRRSIPLDKKVGLDAGQTPISGLRTREVSIFSLPAFSLLSLLIAMTFDWHRTRRLPEWCK